MERLIRISSQELATIVQDYLKAHGQMGRRDWICELNHRRTGGGHCETVFTITDKQ